MAGPDPAEPEPFLLTYGRGPLAPPWTCAVLFVLTSAWLALLCLRFLPVFLERSPGAGEAPLPVVSTGIGLSFALGQLALLLPFVRWRRQDALRRRWITLLMWWTFVATAIVFGLLLHFAAGFGAVQLA